MAESKRDTGVDQCLLSRRNITGMKDGEGGRIRNSFDRNWSN
jgi:hypothetical protein